MVLRFASRFLLLAIVAISLPQVQADTVYRSVDEKGVVEFSDTGKEGAEEIKVQKVPTYEFKKQKVVEPRTNPAPREQKRYIKLLSPTEKQTVRDNQGNLTVSVSLVDGTSDTEKPGKAEAGTAAELNEGEKIVIMLDNAIVTETQQTSVDLQNIDRGTHHLKALIVDQQGKPLAETQEIEFYMKRFSKLFKKPANPVKTN